MYLTQIFINDTSKTKLITKIKIYCIDRLYKFCKIIYNKSAIIQKHVLLLTYYILFNALSYEAVYL